MVESLKQDSASKKSYESQANVERLLGAKGMVVLDKLVGLVRHTATKQRWPLVRVDVRAIHDPEVKGWEYVLLLPVFDCSFDVAETYLHKLYDDIDAMADRLSKDENDILQKLIFFDVETVI